jgi:PPOX class probable F420-dependent enzyme
MTPAEARAAFAQERVARLATVDAAGRPHLVPFVFAVDGDVVVSAVDAKPKVTRELRRLQNVRANPRVAVLADHYDDADWSALWWARGDGAARVVAADSADGRAAVALLAARYAQYADAPPGGPVLVVEVDRWVGWRAAPRAPRR